MGCSILFALLIIYHQSNAEVINCPFVVGSATCECNTTLSTESCTLNCKPYSNNTARICRDDILTCRDNDNCIINCEEGNACSNARIYCPANADCSLSCITSSNKKSCINTRVYWNNAANFQCTGDCANVNVTSTPPTTAPTMLPTIPSNVPTRTPSETPSTMPTFQPTTSQPTTSQPTTSQPTTSQPTTSQPTTSQPTTSQPTTSQPTTMPTFQPTTSQPTTSQPTTSQPTTSQPTTSQPTTSNPTTSNPTTYNPTTSNPTTSQPTTTQPTTATPTTYNPTTFNPTTSNPTTSQPTTSNPTTYNPTTYNPTTYNPTTSNPTTSNPTTSNPTTSNPTTSNPTTSNPTTSNPTTSNPTTSNPTTYNPTTSNATTSNPTTSQPTTSQPTTSQPTTSQPTTTQPTTATPTTYNPTTSNPTTSQPTTSAPTTSNPTTSQPTTSETTTSNPTITPTKIPSTSPSKFPSLTPIKTPSKNPTFHPTNIPSIHPSLSPTITSNSPTTTPTQTGTSFPTANPSVSPTNLPSINPSLSPTIPSNSPSQTPVKTDSSTPTTFPSLHPIQNPTIGPAYNASPIPTLNPIMSQYNDIIIVDISPDAGTIISRPYERFVLMIEFMIKSEFKFDNKCMACFEWFMNDESVTDIKGIKFYNEEISSSVVIDNISYDRFESYLIIEKSKQNNNINQYCMNATNSDTHLLQAGNAYNFQLKIKYGNNYYYESELIDTIVHHPPFGGHCQIDNFEHFNSLSLLQPFHLKCFNWQSQQNEYITYNALLNDILMSNQFESNASDIIGRIPVGEFIINVLIKDNLDTVSCYTIEATIVTVNELNNKSLHNSSEVVSLVERVTNIIGNTTQYTDSVAMTLGVVVNNLNIGSEIQTSLNEAIIADTFHAFNSKDFFNDLSVTSSALSTTTSTFAVSSALNLVVYLTSNPVFINEDVMDLFIDEIIPTIFNVFDVYINQNSFRKNRKIRRLQEWNETSMTNTNALPGMVRQSQNLFMNLEGAVAYNMNDSFWNKTVSEINDISDILMENTLYASNIAIVDSFPGEIYSHNIFNNHTNTSKYISSTKFENNNNRNQTIEFGLQTDNIVIPMNFTESIYIGEITGSFVKTELNNFVPSMDGYEPVSDIIAVNVYPEYTGDDTPIEHETNQCDPYLITIKIDNESILHKYDNIMNDMTIKEIEFPRCNFWEEEEEGDWSDIGCFVYDVSFENNSLICGCIHLSTFQASADSFIPQTNTIGIWHFRNLTFNNLITYPIVMITLLLIFVLILTLCFFSRHENENRSILAYEDIVFEATRNEKLRSTDVGKQIDYISRYLPNQSQMGNGMHAMISGKTHEESKSYMYGLCKLQLGLYSIQLRNEHTLISVFQKTEGTNFSARQRLGCFYIYLITVSVGTAMIYGIEQKNLMGDLSASFLVSLFGVLPVFVIRNLFIKSKPKIKPMTYDFDLKQHKKRYQRHIKLQQSSINSETFFINNKDPKTKKKPTHADVINEFSQQSEIEQLIIVNNIREQLFNAKYPIHHTCKKIAWIILIIWAIIVNIGAIQYGLMFDLKYTKHMNTKNSHLDEFNIKCWQNNKKLLYENNLSDFTFSELNKDLEEENDYSDNYGIKSESVRWLLVCIQSFILSIFIWQPLVIYITTWICIWLFSWNLGFGLGAYNLLCLFKHCCRNCFCKNNDETPELRENISKKELMFKGSKYWLNMYQNRPLDLMGYFATDILFAKLQNPNDKIDVYDMYKDTIYDMNDMNDQTEQRVTLPAVQTGLTYQITELSTQLTPNTPLTEIEMITKHKKNDNIMDDILNEIVSEKNKDKNEIKIEENIALNDILDVIDEKDENDLSMSSDIPGLNDDNTNFVINKIYNEIIDDENVQNRNEVMKDDIASFDNNKSNTSRNDSKLKIWDIIHEIKQNESIRKKMSKTNDTPLIDNKTSENTNKDLSRNNSELKVWDIIQNIHENEDESINKNESIKRHDRHETSRINNFIDELIDEQI